MKVHWGYGHTWESLGKSIFLTGQKGFPQDSERQTNAAGLHARRCCVPPILWLSWYVIAAHSHLVQVDLILEKRCQRLLQRPEECLSFLMLSYTPLTSSELSLPLFVSPAVCLVLLCLGFPLPLSVFLFLASPRPSVSVEQVRLPFLCWSLLNFRLFLHDKLLSAIFDSTEHAEDDAEWHSEQERDTTTLSW